MVSVPLALLCVALSVSVAVRFAGDGWRASSLLLVGVVGVAVLSSLALRRFEYFVLVLLVGRATVDWFKVDTGLDSPPGPLATTMSAILLAAAVLWLTAQLAKRERRPLPRVAWALGALTVACFASVPSSAEPSTSLLEAARFLSAAAMYLVLERLVTSAAAVRRLLSACYVSALVPLTVGLVHATTGTTPVRAGEVARLQSTFTHPNAFGYYLALLSIMAIALLPHTRGRTRLGLSAVLALGLGELVLTYSRGSWLALLVGLVVVALLQSRWLLVVIVAVLVVTPVTVPSVSERVADLGNERTVTGSSGNSLVWRFDYWRATLPLVQRQLLTGVGLKMTTRLTDEGNIPHNDYVRTLVELGLLGICAYLFMLLSLARAARLALKRARPGLGTGVAVGYAACVASFCIVSVGTNRITSVVELWYFFAFTAAAAAVARSMPQQELAP